MPTVSIRDLANRASRVVDAVNTSGRPALVTNRGRPVAAIVPVPEDALEDWVLASAPEFLANMGQALTEIAAGDEGVSLGDAFAALDKGPAALDALIAHADVSSPGPRRRRVPKTATTQAAAPSRAAAKRATTKRTGVAGRKRSI